MIGLCYLSILYTKASHLLTPTSHSIPLQPLPLGKHQSVLCVHDSVSGFLDKFIHISLNDNTSTGPNVWLRPHSPE